MNDDQTLSLGVVHIRRRLREAGYPIPALMVLEESINALIDSKIYMTWKSHETHITLLERRWATLEQHPMTDTDAYEYGYNTALDDIDTLHTTTTPPQPSTTPSTSPTAA